MNATRGVSIIAATLTLLTLAVFGASVVGIVATEQEVRGNEYQRLRAFYAAMTGLEYGLREIAEGGYPNATNAPFNGATFTTQVVPAAHTLTVTGVAGVAQRTYQVTIPQLAGDCSMVDASGANPIGPQKSEINRVKISKLCLNKVRIDQVQIGWVPDSGQRLIRLDYDGNTIYNDATGVPTGTIVDVVDSVIADANEHQFSRMLFSASIENTTMTLTVFFSDHSTATATWVAKGKGKEGDDDEKKGK